MIRVLQLALAASILAVAALGIAGLTRSPEVGVIAEDPGGTVVHVDPGGPAWRNGVRVGDTVLELMASDAETGWRLVTSNGIVVRATEAASILAVHRAHIGWAVVGLVLAFLIAVAAYRGLAASSIAMPIALGVAAQPLFFAGNVMFSVIGGVAVFAAGGLSARAFVPIGPPLSMGARRDRRKVTIATAVIGLGLAAAWVGASLAIPSAYDLLDVLRWPSVVGFATVGAVLIIDRRALKQAVLGGARPGFADLAYGSIATALLLLLAVGLHVDLLVVVLIGVTAIAVYPVWRRASVAAFDRLITAEARREAAINAIEDERGRVARDLHDAPLQELAGAIRQLDAIPGTADGIAMLRNVAAHLRDVTSQLRPPVLDDLGLAAAIEDLAQTHAAKNMTIAVALDDLTRDGSPPGEVAIAAYRVAQEAIGNAVHHSGGDRLTITGVVAADTVIIEVVDDGHGYEASVARHARALGHFGLDSMKERASAVKGTIIIDSSERGTSVAFTWRR